MSSPEPLMIVGAGGHGREVLWIAQSLPERWQPLGFLDDSPQLVGQTLCGAPVLGTIDQWPRYCGASFIIAVGDPRMRKQIAERMAGNGAPVKFATLIHPEAVVSPYAEIGAGTVVCVMAVVTTQVRIGRHCLIHNLANVAHDVEMGDFCSIYPHAALSGAVRLGAGVTAGTSALLLPGVSVGEWTTLSAGSVVSKPAPAYVVMAGSPARRIRRLDAAHADAQSSIETL